MATSTLIAHVDSSLTTRDALALLPAPVARGRFHKPIPHAEVVNATYRGLEAAGFAITREALAVSRSGDRLFGVFDVRPAGVDVPTVHGFAYGFRSSTNSSLALRAVAGLRVVVCDNLALSGDEFVLRRKSTTHVRLEQLVAAGIQRWIANTSRLQRDIAAARETRLTDSEARALAYDVFADGVLPLRLLPAVHHGLFDQPAQPIARTATGALAIGVAPDERLTRWGVHSACTWALQQLPAPVRFPATVRLGRALLSRTEGH